MDGGEQFTLRQSKRVRHDTFDENLTTSHKRARDDRDGRDTIYACDTRQLKLPREHYTIGWIAALPIEMAAAKGMLDNIHESLDRVENDTNTYVLGNIGKHNIVIACLPNNGYGTTNAATVAGNMRRSFDSIQVFLVVGVAGGVPEKADLRLGDVVIGNEVVQYDFGKTGPGGIFKSTGSLNKPPQSLMTAVSALRAHHESKPNEIAGNLSDMLRKYPHMSKYKRPEDAPDRLFKSTYDGNSHIQGTDHCESCEDGELVLRPTRTDTNPRVFYGRVASGNQVMKHGATRERLAQEHNVLCFEMEAAGLMDGFSCLPVRGVCDYSDSHKNKRYQEYAAATAAAYVKELLSVLSPFAVDTIPDKEPSPLAESEPEPDEFRNKKLLDTLRYQQINTRHETIKAAHRKTCKWFMEQPEFTAWRDASQRAEHHGFLWITGKPGAGKSTIMKYVFESEKRKRNKNHATLSFFFSRRGDAIEWSIAGMYRSLIHQLLHRYTDLQSILDDPKYDPWIEDPEADWDVETLRDLFSDAISRLGSRSLTCYIDALDECDQKDIWEMLEHLEFLGEQALESNTDLYICFASRHYPHIDIKHRIKSILEDQPGHKRDLEVYVQSKLRTGGEVVDEIRKTILRKSDGVFMWVVLVVDILNQEFLDGRAFAVKRRLQELPPGLSDLFRDILERDKKNMKDLLLCIQWILYAQRPLKCSEFYLAVMAGLEPTAEDLKWDDGIYTPDQVRRFISSSSKGLAETTKSDEPTVQFIHESVRDFLITDNGIHELWPEYSAQFEAFSHEQLKACCHMYIRSSGSNGAIAHHSRPDDPSHERRKNRSLIAERFPLLEYATKNIFLHAEKAIDFHTQNNFLRKFDVEEWGLLRQASTASREVRDSSLPTLLHEFTENNLTGLLRTSLEDDCVIDPLGGQYRYPLFAALSNGHKGAVVELLRRDSTDQEAKDIAEGLTYGDDLTNHKHFSPLHWAAARGHAALLRVLLKSATCSPNLEDLRGRTPLKLAAEFAHDGAAEVLLEDKAVQYFFKEMGCTPLIWSIPHGYYSLVNLLLRKGADPNEITDERWTPLIIAIIHKQEAIANALLNCGKVDVHHRDIHGRTALHYASEFDRHSIVLLLLDQESIDADVKDANGVTPLMIAAQRGFTDIMKSIILKDSGLVNSQDGNGRTALWRASAKNRLGAVKLLLYANSIDIDVRDQDGTTHLMNAVQSGFLDVVKLLCRKADASHANFKDKLGRTALWSACRAVRSDMVEQLLKIEGIDPDLENEDGVTPLSIAARFGGSETIQLLQPKANANIRDRAGRSPLWWASRSERPSAIEALLRFEDIEIDARDEKGDSPLSIAAQHGSSHVVQILSRRANVNSANDMGQTPLWWAAARGYLLIIETLLQSPEIDTNIQDCEGHTPLLIAAVLGNMGAVRILAADKRVCRTTRGNDGLSAEDWLETHDAWHVIPLLKQ